jgi:putative hydrolase of the HAD superfamily
MPIEALLLDLGGVFLIPDGSLVAESLANAGVPIGPADFEQAHYAGITAVDEGNSERAGTLRYLGGYVGALGIQPEGRPQAMKALLALWEMPSVNLWRQTIPESIVGLRRLAAKGVLLGFVSNSDGTAEEQLRQHRIGQVGPGHGVEVVVITDSAVIGVAKPDPRVFDSAVDALGLSPERIAYVGDSVRYDVLGSEAAGMMPVHFDPNQTCQSGHEHRHVEAIVDLQDILSSIPSGSDGPPPSAGSGSIINRG